MAALPYKGVNRMTKQPSILFLATFVALLALITLVLGPGRLLLPDRGAAVDEGPSGLGSPVDLVATDSYLRLTDQELVQLASLTEAPIDQPVDWGPYRVVPGTHPEWATHMASVVQPLTPEQAAWAEAWSRNAVTSWQDARSRIPGGLRQPRFLPPGASEHQVLSGNIGPDGSYSIRYDYGKPRAGGEKPGEPGTAIQTAVVVGQVSGLRSIQPPIYIENGKSRIIFIQVGMIQGHHAVFRLPRPDAPQTNPKSIGWFKDGIAFSVSDESGGLDLPTLIRIAESVP